MKGMIFKKVLLFSGVLLLSTLMLVQLSWGCDDDDKDKWDNDHHDKWDCHKHGKPCQPPKIQRVFLEYGTESIVFEIFGKNFDNGATPVVTLGGIYNLTLAEPVTENRIVAELSPIPEGFKYGDYRLVVSTCRGSACNDKYCKDHGPNCKCKYCKDHCSKWKHKYCKDNEYKCKCKDRYALTIADPSGQAPPVVLKIESNTIKQLTSEIKIEGSADCGTGYRVTGGGYSCSKCSSILVNEPLQDIEGNGIGWHVVGTFDEITPELELKIFAICTQAQ